MSKEIIKVGMAAFNIATAPASLVTIGLGSCVGVCLWDSAKKIGGLVHIMLPDSTQARNVTNKAKYADTGIALLVEEMIKKGTTSSRLTAKIAGGAQMFNFPGSTSVIRIGERNIEAVRMCLKRLNIRILAEEVGGSCGRTIEFFTVDGLLHIKTINQGEKTV